MSRVVPVVLAGGSGTRLWPLSREAFPKQFQPLTGARSTYQETLLRLKDPDLFADPVVITSGDFRFFARGQAEEVGVSVTVVLEPERRDSAAAIAAAALVVERLHPGALMMALAADHVVLDVDLFRDAVRRGLRAAEDGRIVVFGIEPTEPKTAYGYIRAGAPLGPDLDVMAVERFVEKPDLATATTYCRDGYLWNAGNFLARADRLIADLRTHAADVIGPVERSVLGATDDFGFLRLEPASFAAARRTSIDYAVLEKTADVAVVRCRFRWSDVGAFDAVWQVSPHDGAGNAVVGPVVAADTRDSLIHSDGTLTTVIGLDNIVVVSTADAVLVADRARSEQVKGLVERLRAAGRSEVEHGRSDYRIWGRLEFLDAGDGFAVRRVVMNPGSGTSRQRHLHRSEHWVVVRGTARIDIDGEESRTVAANMSFFVPQGVWHRLSNGGEGPLEIIEVRTGGYLGEDDVEREEE
jgi:mannose-1-phosphate guanylyltransferase/mannose-6-phosphate isomerase